MKKNQKIILGSIVGAFGIAAIGAGLGTGLANANNQTHLQQPKKQVVNKIATPNQPTVLNHTQLSNNNQQTNMFTHQVVVNNVTYNVNISNFSASVAGFAQVTHEQTALTIPSAITYKGINFPVTSIQTGAFYNSALTAINLPSGLVSIGAYSFANNFLQTLVIPSSVQSIGNNAFSNNPFNYDTVINLGPDCTWNKTSALCPFPNNDNYSKFVPSVSFVIQNQAVYQWQPNQNGWIVTSYMPSIGDIQQTGYAVTKHQNTNSDKFDGTYKQRQIYRTSKVTLNPFLFSKSLSTNFLKIGTTYSGFTFDLQTMTMKLVTSGSNQQAFNQPTSGSTLSVYSPTNNAYTYNQTFQSSATVQDIMNSFSSTGGIKFQYGDVISLSGTWAKYTYADVHFTNLYNFETNSIGLTNYIYTGIASWQSECMYDANLAWNVNEQQLNTQFMITPYGLIPYTNLINLTPLTVLNGTNTTEFNVTGTTLPNRKVSVSVNGQTFNGTTNQDGQFNILVNNQSNLTTSTIVTVNVQGIQPYTAHLLGDNPVNSSLMFNVNGCKFSILFNGITKKLSVYYQGTFELVNRVYYPSFTNPSFLASNTPNLNGAKNSLTQAEALATTIGSFWQNSVQNFDFDINIQQAVTTSTGTTYKTISEYPIKINRQTTLQQLINEIEQVPYENNTIYQIVFPNGLQNFSWHSGATVGVLQMLSNHAKTPIGLAGTAGGTCWNRILVNNTGITNLLTTPTELSNAYINSYDPTYGTTYEGMNYGIRMMGHYGGLETGSMEGGPGANNFYDISKIMKEVCEGSSSALTTDYAKALAIFNFVTNNMTYNDSTGAYAYGHTIQGTFRHMTGVCGNFADLTAVLCSADGLVSRVIVGSAANAANIWSQQEQIDHAWAQFWAPSLKEWITIDPTWHWAQPFGQVQANFNLQRNDQQVAAVFWPQNTNYFSYFKGEEYQALNHLGGYFCMAQGRVDTQFSIQNAIAAVNVLNNTVGLQNGYYVTYSKQDN